MPPKQKPDETKAALDLFDEWSADMDFLAQKNPEAFSKVMDDVKKRFEESWSLTLHDDAVNYDNETRWVRGSFFDGGVSKNLRLDERHNQQDPNDPTPTDTSDVQLATEILLRADLLERIFSAELVELFARALATIKDPVKFANPNHGVNKDVGKR